MAVNLPGDSAGRGNTSPTSSPPTSTPPTNSPPTNTQGASAGAAGTQPSIGGPAPTPAHRDLRLLGLVFAGGTIGTLVRAALEAVYVAPPGSWPWATFAINVSGACALGALLEWLGRLGPDTGWRRGLRLAVGTGVLGGYTTYSTFAVEVTELARGAALLAAAYALISVVLGIGAAAAGLTLARRLTSARDVSPARWQP